MSNIKKIIRFTAIGTGSEYTGGIIDNDSLKEKIKEKISDGSVSSSMDFDGEDFSAHNHTNIVHIYGPDFHEANFMLEESYDVDIEDDDRRDYKEIFNTYCDDFEDEHGTYLKTFISANPYPDQFTSGFSDDDIIFYSQKMEKRIHYPVVIEIAEDEEFDINNLYIGGVLVDETHGTDEGIVEDILYIPTEDAKKYCKEFRPEHWERIVEDYPGDLIDAEVKHTLYAWIEEIYNEMPELKNKIRNNHLIAPTNIEGKGEYENDGIRITSLDGEVLFEQNIL